MKKFEELEKKQLERYGKPPEEVKKKIDGTINFINFLTNVVELYVSQIGVTVLGFLKSMEDSEEDEIEKK